MEGIAVDSRTEATVIADPARPWEVNSQFWIEIIRRHRDRYRGELTDAAIRAAIGDPAGLDVLDAGCGEGYMTRWAAENGSRTAHGLDRSAGLIAAAEAARVPGTSFSEGDAAGLPFADGSFDLVIANHVLNDLPDVAGPVSEFGRVLRPGGRLVIMMLHPCFYDGDGGRPETSPLSGMPGTGRYFAQRPVTQAFQVDGLTSPAASTSWVRPLEAYTGALTEAGLHVLSMSEPHPAGTLAGDPWWRENFPRPLFLLIAASKPNATLAGASDQELLKELQRRLARSLEGS